MSELGDLARATTANERPLVDWDDPEQQRALLVGDRHFTANGVYRALLSPADALLFWGLSAQRDSDDKRIKADRYRIRRKHAEANALEEQARKVARRG